MSHATFASHALISSIRFFTASKAAVEFLPLQAKLFVLVEVCSSIKHLVGFVQGAPDQSSASLQPSSCYSKRYRTHNPGVNQVWLCGVYSKSWLKSVYTDACKNNSTNACMYCQVIIVHKHVPACQTELSSAALANSQADKPTSANHRSTGLSICISRLSTAPVVLNIAWNTRNIACWQSICCTLCAVMQQTAQCQQSNMQHT